MWNRINMRRYERSLLAGEVRAAWQDHGVFRISKARLIDFSEGGIQIELPERVEVRLPIHLRAELYNLDGYALVRYCRRVGQRFRVGLRFSEGVRLEQPAAAYAGNSNRP